MKMKPLFILSLCCLCLQAFGEEYTYRLASPDKNLEVNISVGQKITYSVRHKDRVLLNASPIGLVFLDRTLGADAKVIRKKESSFTEDIQSPHYRVPSFTVTYNELDLKMKGNYGVVFRAYNEGMAYRFYTTMKDSVIVEDEIASFNFPENYTSYMAYSTAGVKSDQYAMAFQNTYTVSTVKEAEADNIAFLPITLDCGDEVKMTLLESDLESYPGMFIEKGNGESCSLKATFARYPKALERFPPRAMTKVVERSDYIAKAAGKRNYPWRIWAVTEKDTEMPVNNLVYALASPNRIGDCSWIKTGKVAWEWWNDWGISGVGFKAGINMDTYKHYIDFAAENGIEFVVLDEGWYNPAKGDMLAVIPELNLEELVRYGKSKGVDLILWTVFNVLDEQLEEACRKYSAMGISGFKVDFLDRDDQTAVEMACRIAEMTAKYRLTLDLHGFYKPTGMNRTYPNVINYESVFGMEEMKWSTVDRDMMEYDVTMPYIRMMAGPVDYTPGAMRNAAKRDFKPIYHNPMSQGTRCHQLAAYVVHDSPLTMLADNPTIYRKEQECTDFIVGMPNKGIDETRILQGKLGEFIVTARRTGSAWYVGGMTDWTPRSVTLDFSFLGEGTYDVILFRDGINADRQAEDYVKEAFSVTSTSRKNIWLAPGGGFAMSVVKR
ncbi:glycoside hydrolase family 97 protein [Bacteroides gallinaceum]|uniref:Glycoside hydrolase family 97 protein n=1 Tax=Bacteroides gallinaceum TaxID=1462571 RepID=A0ABT7VG10_9BACE|nr:glycoside hydrolase family 97 protein [Bacteroides gallinaceum]MDM8325238.1 glycoside hydrolase family 97 protein [Bacteroides gallinaceum]